MTVTPIRPRFTFTPAAKTGAWLRLAFMGPSGGGRTFTALTLAEVLGPNLGVIDTDRKRARKYADLFTFRHFEMDGSFDPVDLTRATLEAAAQGINPLVVDTMTPFWNGPEGMLDKVGKEKTSHDGWRKMGPIETTMMDALLGYPGHVLLTLKTKTKFEADVDASGKTKARRIGMEPEQRGGFGSECDVVFDMADHGIARVGSTCLCPELAGRVYEQPGPELAETLLAWLGRNAVGEPLNPLAVAEWATAPDRTLDELGAKFAELDAAGQTGAIVFNPRWTGSGADEFVAIGALLRTFGTDARKRANAAAAAAVAAATPSDSLGASLVEAAA